MNCPVARGAQTEQRLGNLSPSGTDQPVKSQHLTTPHLKADILKKMAAGQLPHLKRDITKLMGHSSPAQIELAPDHHLRDALFIRFSGDDSALILPVTQDGDTVGDLENFFHAVRDIDDPDTL